MLRRPCNGQAEGRRGRRVHVVAERLDDLTPRLRTFRAKVRAKVEHLASDWHHQASVWLRQSALPRAQKERSSPHCHLRAGQSVYRTPASIALRGGVIYLAWPPAVANVEDVTPITVPPIPNCHWLLQFQWPVSAPSSLIQTFPRQPRCEPGTVSAVAPACRRQAFRFQARLSAAPDGARPGRCRH